MGKQAKAEVPVYTIGVVEAMTGLTGRRIRYYEQMNLLSPARTKGNQRLYSEADVARLLRIKELLAQGLNIEGIRAVLRLDEEAEKPAAELPLAFEGWAAEEGRNPILETYVSAPEPLNPSENLRRLYSRRQGLPPAPSSLRFQRLLAAETRTERFEPKQ
ncbi:MAG: MerR family transcriptional regulator [Bacillota bacterium]|nr:MerR family transcriptional regulator [Bacillota bacterium]